LVCDFSMMSIVGACLTSNERAAANWNLHPRASV
jgi:hypothetical protein